jgi:hypothetical protein
VALGRAQQQEATSAKCPCYAAQLGPEQLTCVQRLPTAAGQASNTSAGVEHVGSSVEVLGAHVSTGEATAAPVTLR